MKKYFVLVEWQNGGIKLTGDNLAELKHEAASILRNNVKSGNTGIYSIYTGETLTTAIRYNPARKIGQWQTIK